MIGESADGGDRVDLDADVRVAEVHHDGGCGRALVRAQAWGVVDKLLLGSDYPMWTPTEAVAGLPALTEVGPGTEPATFDWLFDGDPRTALGVTR